MPAASAMITVLRDRLLLASYIPWPEIIFFAFEVKSFLLTFRSGQTIIILV